MYNNFNPYQNTPNSTGNTLKNFFKKPITLVLAALFIACAILPAVYFMKLANSLGDLSRVKDYISMSLGGIFSAPITMEELFNSGSIIIMVTSVFAPLLIAVALIMLFTASRSTNPNTTGKNGCSALIGGASVASFGMTYTACMILFPLVDLFDRMGDTKFSDELTSYVVRLIVTLCALFLYSVSFGIFTRSVYKNLSAPKATGRFAACLFGISSILVAAVYMLFTIDISASMGDSISDDGNLLLSVFALSALNYIVTAVFAFMFSAHIKNQRALSFAPSVQQVAPVEPTVNTAPEKTSAPVYAPVTSQPVVARTAVSQTEAEPSTDIPAFCPECGSPVAQNQLFCAECGTKLN